MRDGSNGREGASLSLVSWNISRNVVDVFLRCENEGVFPHGKTDTRIHESKHEMKTLAVWAILLGWVAVAAMDGGGLSAQTPHKRLLHDLSGMKQVADASAEVMEFITKTVPVQRDLVIQVPEILILHEPATWDDREMALAVWNSLRENLAALTLFREIRAREPGQLLFQTASIDAAPAEGMSRTWLEVEGRLVDMQTGNVLGRVRVRAEASGGAGTVSRAEAERVPERIADALARFVGKVFR